MEYNNTLDPDLKPKDGNGLESTLNSFRFGSHARNIILKASFQTTTASDAATAPPHDDAVKDHTDKTDIHRNKPLVTTVTTKHSAPTNPPKKTSKPKPPPPELIAIKRAPKYLSVCPPGKIPLAPFINKAKFPRKFRNTLLRKLFSEHLALLAAENNWLAPQKAVKRDDLMEVATRLALEQELEVYNKCQSGGAYQNFAAKCSALQYGTTHDDGGEEEESNEDSDSDSDEPVLHNNTRDKKRPRLLEVVEEIYIFSDEEKEEEEEEEKKKQREEDTPIKKNKSKTISAWHQVKAATARWVSDKVDLAIADDDDDDDDNGSLSEMILETVKGDITLQILGRHVGETTTAFLDEEEEGIKRMIEEAITSQF